MGSCFALSPAGLIHQEIGQRDRVIDVRRTFRVLPALGAVLLSREAEVTDDKSLPKAERKRLQIEHAAEASPEAQLVKLADKKGGMPRNVFPDLCYLE